MYEIRYSGGPASVLSYRGRNGCGQQAGIAIHDQSRDGRQVLHVYPITSRGTVSDACYLEVPADAVPAFISALRSFINPG